MAVDKPILILHRTHFVISCLSHLVTVYLEAAMHVLLPWPCKSCHVIALTLQYTAKVCQWTVVRGSAHQQLHDSVCGVDLSNPVSSVVSTEMGVGLQMTFNRLKGPSERSDCLWCLLCCPFHPIWSPACSPNSPAGQQTMSQHCADCQGRAVACQPVDPRELTMTYQDSAGMQKQSQDI